jgi:metal-responsive CopG/Arc/MetJ family transcriptional regulator
MQVKTNTLIRVQVTLNDDEANRLHLISQRSGIKPSDLIAKAIHTYIERKSAEVSESDAWMALSLSAFEEAWDNEQDAIYDNYK